MVYHYKNRLENISIIFTEWEQEVRWKKGIDGTCRSTKTCVGHNARDGIDRQYGNHRYVLTDKTNTGETLKCIEQHI